MLKIELQLSRGIFGEYGYTNHNIFRFLWEVLNDAVYRIRINNKVIMGEK